MLCYAYNRQVKSLRYNKQWVSLSKKSQSVGFWNNIDMLTEKKTIERDTLEIMCTEMLAPKQHLLRKIDEAVDFERLYEIVGDLYCKDNGRPSIDPIVLFVSP